MTMVTVLDEWRSCVSNAKKKQKHQKKTQYWWSPRSETETRSQWCRSGSQSSLPQVVPLHSWMTWLFTSNAWTLCLWILRLLVALRSLNVSCLTSSSSRVVLFLLQESISDRLSCYWLGDRWLPFNQTENRSWLQFCPDDSRLTTIFSECCT